MTLFLSGAPRSRRPLLALGLAATAAVALAGCKPAGSAPGATGPTPPPTTTSSAVAAPGPSAPPTPSSPPGPSATSAPTGSSTNSSTPAAASTTTTTLAAPPARACRITIAYGPADGTAGSTYTPVEFTNTGQDPCRLTGGAQAEFLAADRTTVVGDSTAIPGGTVTLAPGASVTSTMRSTATHKFDEERCGSVPVSGLRITPPADADPVTLPSPVGNTVCDGIIRGQLSFTPLPTPGEGP